MASMQSIKGRIKSVISTQHITKAMNLVASSKLQKAKTKLKNARPFYHETKETVARVVLNSKGLQHHYLVERPVKKIVVILVTGDRGLCGGYNVNASKEARKMVRGKTDGSLLIVGTKGRDFFIRRRKPIIKTFIGISENPFYEDAVEIGEMALELYNRGDADEIYLVYTEFISTMTHVPKTVRLLPVDTESLSAKPANHDDSIDTNHAIALMNYEPDEASVLDYVIPKYINTLIFGALVESATCQQSARMTSMDAATENAEDMISKLSLQYNRARQGAITQEITEIVSGANALD